MVDVGIEIELKISSEIHSDIFIGTKSTILLASYIIYSLSTMQLMYDNLRVEILTKAIVESTVLDCN
jgi:hypothetical protein